jgi:hypothetical protein
MPDLHAPLRGGRADWDRLRVHDWRQVVPGHAAAQVLEHAIQQWQRHAHVLQARQQRVGQLWRDHAGPPHPPQQANNQLRIERRLPGGSGF